MITLGLVANVDTDGVYVTMPGSRGVLRGPYQTVQNVAAGDRVLMVTTDDGENVIVGLAAPESPRSSPASSTDNTVPRFDGTGGALQTSGVTIDDSDNVVGVGNLTQERAYPTHVLNGVGGAGGILWQTSGSNRFDLGMDDSPGDLRIIRRNDSGGWEGEPLRINRATGKITLGDVGATAGLEFGAGGPTITTGTGAPSHSAPDGSLYTRQDGTASTTLYVRAAGAWSALS